MSSFSSFVRKPGKVAAPKKIPQRRPPKSATTASVQDDIASDATNGLSATNNHLEGSQSGGHASDKVVKAIQTNSQQDEPEDNGNLNNESPSQNAEPQAFTTHRPNPPSSPPPDHTNSQKLPNSQLPPQVAVEDHISVTPENQETSNATVRSTAPREARSPSEEQQGTVNEDVNAPAGRTRGQKAKRSARSTAIVNEPELAPTAASTQETDDILSQSIPQTSAIPPSPTPSHADVFQQITSRLQNGIQQFRASQTPSRAGSVVPSHDGQDTAREGNGPNASNGRPRKRRKRNDGQSQTIQEQVAEVIAHATGNEDLTPRVRRGTPEDAEEHEIEPDTIKLAELCDDRKWGKKSNREKEMAANWPEILRRRKQENEERMQKAEERRSRKRKDQPLDGDTGLIVPEQAIVNGEIVAASRVVDNRAQIVLEANDESRPILEARDIFNRVTQETIAPRRKLPSGQFWDEANTALFYQGLSMFGTDFNMIANMIPTKNRRQVKLKYNVEERSNWSKVKAALNKTENVSLDQYSNMTGLTFGSVEDLYKELEEDEKRIRAEDEARRKEEGIISQPADGDDGVGTNVEADIAVPSIEEQEGDQPIQLTGSEAPSDRARSTATTRLGSATTGGRQTAQPPGANKKKPTRKTNPNTKRGRQAANKRNNFEGIEESLGPADQVRVPMT